MELTKEERQILTLLDDCPADTYVDHIRTIVDYPRSLIETLAERFQTEGLIKTVQIPCGDDERDWFFCTEKVTDDMMDDDVRYLRDFGSYNRKRIVYQIEEETEEGPTTTITARRTSIDSEAMLRYERIELPVPKGVRDQPSIIFAVISVEADRRKEVFNVRLCAYADPPSDASEEPCPSITTSGCFVEPGRGIEADLAVSREVLKSWTGLDNADIDRAFDSISMDSTYNLLLSLPRTITLTRYDVVVSRNIPSYIDPQNLCGLLLRNEHPIDKTSV